RIRGRQREAERPAQPLEIRRVDPLSRGDRRGESGELRYEDPRLPFGQAIGVERIEVLREPGVIVGETVAPAKLDVVEEAIEQRLLDREQRGAERKEAELARERHRLRRS